MLHQWTDDLAFGNRQLRAPSFPPPTDATKTRKLVGFQTPDAQGSEALFVNKSADETPQGWYCCLLFRVRTTHAHVHVPLCPIPPCQDRNRFLDSHRMAGRAMQGQLPKKPKPCYHLVTTDYPDRKALRTRGQHPWSSCHHCSTCQNPSVENAVSCM